MIQERKRAPQTRSAAKPVKPVKRESRKARQRRSNLRMIRWLVFAWPVGLIFVWGSKWKLSNKIATSVACVALTLIFVFGGFAVWESAQKQAGGMQRVAVEAAVRPYGPKIPEGATYSYDDESIYVPVVVVTPEPTVEPETAFVNDGGKYFHTEGCKYTTKKSGAYNVPYLLRQGFAPCQKCEAQQLADQYMGEN